MGRLKRTTQNNMKQKVAKNKRVRLFNRVYDDNILEALLTQFPFALAILLIV